MSMKIRRYQPADIQAVVNLFYDTIHTVNRRDYSLEQVEAWAPPDERQQRERLLHDSLSTQIAYVAETRGQIIAGFADLTPHGKVDRLFTHWEYQRQGVASALLKQLESEARALGLQELETEASITARPFFEHHGFEMQREQTIERRGVQLTNYRMAKKLQPGVNR